LNSVLISTGLQPGVVVAEEGNHFNGFPHGWQAVETAWIFSRRQTPVPQGGTGINERLQVWDKSAFFDFQKCHKILLEKFLGEPIVGSESAK
jgi:hypothetical protein